MKMNLKENTNLVFQQISNAVQEAGRENDSVSVIAVTKYVDVETASDRKSTRLNSSH